MSCWFNEKKLWEITRFGTEWRGLIGAVWQDLLNRSNCWQSDNSCLFSASLLKPNFLFTWSLQILALSLKSELTLFLLTRWEICSSAVTTFLPSDDETLFGNLFKYGFWHWNVLKSWQGLQILRDFIIKSWVRYDLKNIWIFFDNFSFASCFVWVFEASKKDSNIVIVHDVHAYTIYLHLFIA